MTVLVTGGAGFIGANMAHRLLAAGERVRVLDDLSRKHVDRNVAWLRQLHGDALDLVVGDVRDPEAVAAALADVTQVFHFAAQVAVTTSIVDPVHDFDVNVRGTLVVLEAIRAMKRRPALLYTSTNKVYGACQDVELVCEGGRYLPRDRRLRDCGYDERRPLEFHSPYGCAKGAADQYVLDWSRTYGIDTCVFRMSCIYGPRQFGNEEQGWVAHFAMCAARAEPIVIYGDGRQVRDLLFVGDLLDAMLLARQSMPKISGQVFNVGGGPANARSLLEVIARVEALGRTRLRMTFRPWRTADQRWYVSDCERLERALGWRPRVGIDEGLELQTHWIRGSGLGPERPRPAAWARP